MIKNFYKRGFTIIIIKKGDKMQNTGKPDEEDKEIISKVHDSSRIEKLRFGDPDKKNLQPFIDIPIRDIKDEILKKENFSIEKLESSSGVPIQKINPKKYPTIKLKNERDIAMDFAEKVYKKFDKLVKSIVLFGSVSKQTSITGSDIDIIIVIDDASVRFDERTIVWYREELDQIIQNNPYRMDLHINTVKLTTWWTDLYRGDPVLINVLRYGETLIDIGGFFNPLKILLSEGKIRLTPEAIYNCLSRVPFHIQRSRQAELGSIEGCYWAMIDSSQALLMAVKVMPPSPEHIPILLKEKFVDKGLLKLKYVTDLRDLHDLHRRIMHGDLKNIDGKLIDEWQEKADKFFEETIKLIKKII
jgi:predicted nucleotidyltransferase